MSIPASSTSTCTIYNNFEDEFIESWTDTNEPYCTASELNKLCMNHDNIDTYITHFTKLACKVLYYKDDPTVLEKFKAGLLLELLKRCMHHNDPHNWDAWTKSTHTCQTILTSLKAHKTDEAV